MMDNPMDYSEGNDLQRTKVEELIREFVPLLNIGEGGWVMDVGCGTGDVTAQIIVPSLPKDVSRIIGVDISESMVHYARRNNIIQKLSFLKLDIADETDVTLQKLANYINDENSAMVSGGEQVLKKSNAASSIDTTDKLENVHNDEEKVNVKLVSKGVNNGNEYTMRQGKKEFNNEEMEGYPKFDTVFSFFCLHWVPNQRQALKNIFTLLKHGGEAILALVAYTFYNDMYKEVAKLPKWSALIQDIDNFDLPYGDKNSVEKFSKIAIEAGFQIVTVECRDAKFQFENLTDLLGAVKGVCPFSSRLPENSADEFFNDCLRIIKKFKFVEHTENGYIKHYKLLIAHIKK